MGMSGPHPPTPDWADRPITKPMCPIHGRREDPHVVVRQDEGLVEYACSDPDCERSWIVKRVRV